jgi:ubiquinol-cytochrome c reductase cytochrome c subunit
MESPMRSSILCGLIVAATVDAAVVARVQAPASTPPAPRPAQAAPGDAEAGRKLWVSYGCWQCHGYEGQGGAAGPRLSARNLAFTSFAAYVRRPTNQMPPYTEKVVSNMDLVHIHAFIQSRPAPPAAASIPLLQK